MSTQLCDPDWVLDAAESLGERAGIEAVTLRAVTTVTGTPMAEIYRRYGSREKLIGQAWLRAARRFVGLLATLVDRAHASGTTLDQVLAAAETSLVYPQRYPRSAGLLRALSSQKLLNLAVPEEIIDQLHSVEHEFTEVVTRLSVELWDRKDAAAVGLISACVLELPEHILTGRRHHSASVVRRYLRAAIQGIVEVGPPPIDRGGESGARPAHFSIIHALCMSHRAQ